MTNTIHSVPRDWFDRVHALLYKVAYENTPEGLEAECLGSFIPGILSAPSPAGVDGLEVVAYLIGGEPSLKQCAVRGVVNEPLCRLSDAQAIIDGLRGENHQLQRELRLRQSQIESSGRIAERAQRFAVRLRTERNQQAQRIGELEGLLGETLEDMTNELWQRIDATLSAGKEGE